LIIAVASGKGGTGKTTIATALALAAERPVLFLDCDVEEPNAFLYLKPELTVRRPVYRPVPEVDEEACTSCGRCVDACAYHALLALGKTVVVLKHMCHGCGACAIACPTGALRETSHETGYVEAGRAGAITFAHGELGIGEAMAPPVIRAVKEMYPDWEGTCIIDAPPGTACPVLEAVRGSDFCLLVTEPTPFGLHDLRRMVEVVRALDLACGVIVNRCDLGDDRVGRYCRAEGLPVLLRIPYLPEVARWGAEAISFVARLESWKTQMAALLGRVEEMLGGDRGHQR
jgi:MinD superfamily P-loop ATPase